jgi:hypothetical protein
VSNWSWSIGEVLTPIVNAHRSARRQVTERSIASRTDTTRHGLAGRPSGQARALPRKLVPKGQMSIAK